MATAGRDIYGKILGVMFILSCLPKLLSVQGAVDNFHHWHLGDTWRYVVGLIELTCGVLMFVPGLKRFGAFGFFCIMPAAFIIHITVGEYAMLPLPVVFGVAVLVYLRREHIVRL